MIEANNIYCGHNLDVMKEIEDCSIDLTVTSPPYDDLRDYEGYDFQFETLAKELFRVTRQGGVVVWIVGDATVKGSETGTSFKQALYFKEVGFNLHDTMIYETDKPPITTNRYEPRFEYMMVLSKGKPKTFNPIKVPCNFAGLPKKCNHGKLTGAKLDGRSMRFRNEIRIVNENKITGNIWYYASGIGGTSNDEISFEHPATFPEQLAQDHIFSWSNEGDLILDPMCGSGTTCKMAMLLNRNYIGIDCSEKYCKIAESRIAEAKRQTKIQFGKEG